MELINQIKFSSKSSQLETKVNLMEEQIRSDNIDKKIVELNQKV